MLSVYCAFSLISMFPVPPAPFPGRLPAHCVRVHRLLDAAGRTARPAAVPKPGGCQPVRHPGSLSVAPLSRGRQSG